ncbi:MAG: L,D-transpeptidase family protein [Planctomycetes bacterium]|nr:L,D-transpeptidase family protein [Planctomycetota bacterium]
MRRFLVLVLVGVSAYAGWWAYARQHADAAPEEAPRTPPPPPLPDAGADLREGASLLARGNVEGAEPVLRRAESLADPLSPTHRDACRALADLCERTVRPREARTWRIAASENAAEAAPHWEAIRALAAGLVGGAPSAEDASSYTAVTGDTLEKIARAHGTTIECIRWLNGMGEESVLRAGQRLKLLRGTVRIEVNRSDLTLTVFADDRILKRYPVGIGALDKTPAGEFEVTDRTWHPTWYPAHAPRGIPYGHPDNLLGDGWLKIEGPGEYQGYGIHGTTQPTTIGQRVSNGCVRMHNADIREVFALCPRGTRVIIR